MQCHLMNTLLLLLEVVIEGFQDSVSETILRM